MVRRDMEQDPQTLSPSNSFPPVPMTRSPSMPLTSQAKVNSKARRFGSGYSSKYSMKEDTTLRDVTASTVDGPEHNMYE